MVGKEQYVRLRAVIERAVADLTPWCDGPRNGVQPCDVRDYLRAALDGEGKDD